VSIGQGKNNQMIKIQNKKHYFLAILFDLILKNLIWFFSIINLYKKPKSISEIKVRKILIIEQEPLGDAIMATSVFRHLRKKYPDSKIDVFTGVWARDVFKNNPDINETITCNTPWAFSQSVLSFKGFLGHIRFLCNNYVSEIKNRKYDLAIDLRGDIRNIFFFMVLPGIPVRISYARTGGSYFLSCSHEFVPDQHEIDKNFKLLECLSISTEDRNPVIYPDKLDEQYVEDVLLKHEVKNDSKIAVIHPGAGNSLRFWPTERYIKVAKYLSEKGFKIFLTGTEKEKILTSKIKKKFPVAVELSGMLSIPQMVSLLRRTNILICPDTGIMHLASCTKTLTITLIGPGDPQQIGGYGNNFIFVDKQFPCRPCIQNKCIKTTEDYGPGACIEAIEVSDVIDVIDKTLI